MLLVVKFRKQRKDNHSLVCIVDKVTSFFGLPQQFLITFSYNSEALSGSLAGKESACNAGDPGSILVSGRSSGEGIGYPLQYSWLHTQARQNCDFYIETKNEVFAVKLFCVLKRFSNTLIFTDESEYFIRDFTAIPTLSGGYRLPTNGKINKMINYNYRYHYKNEWEIKDPVNVLLINPVPHEIRRQSKNGNETILGNGDPVHGARIYSLSGFLTILERDKNNLQ